jgi:hypothetical protein
MKRLSLAVFCLALAACGSADITPDAGADAGAQPKKGEVLELDGLKSAVPADWKKEQPTSKLRTYQFRLPKAKGSEKDAELVIFYFGPGSGGSVDANLSRWKGQFKAPEGKTIDEVSRLDTFKVGAVEITYLDISGTYLFKNPPFDPNAKVQPLPDYRRLGVIFASENGPYFITVTGDAKTVASHKKAFDDWLKAFK